MPTPSHARIIRGTEFLIIVNAGIWKGLSEAHKAIMAKAAKAAERAIRDNTARREEQAYQFVRSKGMKVYELTPD